MNDINYFFLYLLMYKCIYVCVFDLSIKLINLFDVYMIIIFIYKLEYDVYSLSVVIYMWNKFLNINKKDKVFVF